MTDGAATASLGPCRERAGSLAIRIALIYDRLRIQGIAVAARPVATIRIAPRPASTPNVELVTP